MEAVLQHEPVLGVGDLAEHVELELVGGGVADPHRRRALVAGQPARLPLHEMPLAGRAVDDLHVLRVADNGAQQPVAPGERLLRVA
jgi:hypothetical protein